MELSHHTESSCDKLEPEKMEDVQMCSKSLEKNVILNHFKLVQSPYNCGLWADKLYPQKNPPLCPTEFLNLFDLQVALTF